MRVFMGQGLCAWWIDSVDVGGQNGALSCHELQSGQEAAIQGYSRPRATMYMYDRTTIPRQTLPYMYVVWSIERTVMEIDNQD